MKFGKISGYPIQSATAISAYPNTAESCNKTMMRWTDSTPQKANFRKWIEAKYTNNTIFQMSQILWLRLRWWWIQQVKIQLSKESFHLKSWTKYMISTLKAGRSEKLVKDLGFCQSEPNLLSGPELVSIINLFQNMESTTFISAMKHN